MPLSKARMREYMRQHRQGKKGLPVIPKQLESVIPVIPKCNLKGAKDDTRASELGITATSVIPKCLPIPRYNRFMHKPGDVVLVQVNGRWVKRVVPEMDGDGNTVPSLI